MSFKNNIVLVTGATSGIGKATSKMFLENGAKVAANYHSDDEKRDRAEKEFRDILSKSNRPESDLLMVNADISNAKEVDAMFREIENQLGRLDILVNNAGMSVENPSHELDPKAVQKELSVNLLGPVYCSIEALKVFLKDPAGGCIVNNSSVHEEIPKPGFLPYSIAKGGIRNLTRTLALEYADRGIRVNAVGPGLVDTPINSFLEQPGQRERVLQHIPQKSIIQPSDIARAILFLANNESRHITGQTLMIDAGLTLYPDFKKNWSS